MQSPSISARGLGLVLVAAGLAVTTSCFHKPEQYDPVRHGGATGGPVPGLGGGIGDARAATDGPGQALDSGEPSDESGVAPDPVTSSCPEGFHVCGTECKDNKSADTCGLSCESCPQIKGGMATCDGTRCAVACPAGQKPCLDSCIPEGDPCDNTCPLGRTSATASACCPPASAPAARPARRAPPPPTASRPATGTPACLSAIWASTGAVTPA